MGKQKRKISALKRQGRKEEPLVCERCGNPVGYFQRTCHFCKFRRFEEEKHC